MISGRGGGGARAGRIRAPRRIIRTNGDTGAFDFEAYWDKLQKAFGNIHNKTSGDLSFEALYRAAYGIVLKKRGQELYDNVRSFEVRWFRDNVTPNLLAQIGQNLVNLDLDRLGTSVNERRSAGQAFLKSLKDAWENHNTSTNMMADILMYLDRGYTQLEPDRVPVFTSTIGIFRDHILRINAIQRGDTKDNILDIMISVILDQIDMERDGDVIDKSLVRSCSMMLASLYETDEEVESEKLYLSKFEPRYIQNSVAFFTRECERLLAEGNATAWLRQTSRRLIEESDRCGTCIEGDTRSKVLKIVDEKLILHRLDDFLALEGTGLNSMIDNDRTDDLSALYKLVCRVDHKKMSLRNELQKKIVALGKEIEQNLHEIDFSTAHGEGDEGGNGEKSKALNPAAQQTAAAIRWVDDVLKLSAKFDRILQQCFDGDLAIQTTQTNSFTEFINLFSRSAEYVSLYIDDSLKRGIRDKTEAEVDGVLERAVVLVQYLRDRDLFQTYYQRHLARRLLHAKSGSHDVENQILSRMKQELGQQFTSKFEGMFRDLVTSAELTSSYKAHIRASGDGSRTIELGMDVLTTNFWPPEVMGRTAQIGEGSRVNCEYPKEIKRLQASFEQFYLSNRNGRKLTWIGTTGTADIRCFFPAVPGKSGALAKDRRYELTVPTFAMVVLLLFNDLEDDEGLTFEEIQAKTNIATQDLKRALTSIAIPPKSRMLNKVPQNKQVKSGDKFFFNTTFQSKAYKFKAPIINAVSKVEDKEERKVTAEKTNISRSYLIDAAVVRIMKARRELAHVQLVSEVISQLSGRFKPDVSLIKARLEDLISREFLERPEDEDGPGTYRYVA